MNDWKNLPLRDVLKLYNGKGAKFDVNGAYPVYGSNGIIGFSAEFRYQNSLIIGRVGVCGSVNLECGKYWASDNTIVADVNDGFDLQFIYYLLGSLPISSLAGGSAQPLINHKILLGIKANIPPIETQRKIAGILSAYDELIETNARRIARLEQLAEEIYREWFVRFRFPDYRNAEFVKGVPATWQIVRFGDVVNFTMGQSPPSETYNENGEGLPFHQGVGTYGNRFPRTVTYCDGKGRKANKGDILFSVRAPVGRLNIADCEMIIGRGLSAMRHKQGHNSYLFYLLKTIFANEDIIGNGSIFASVGKDELTKFQMLQPDAELVARFQSVAADIDAQIESLSHANAKLRATRDLLLPRLLSGKLDVAALDVRFPAGFEE